jgi:hypothetical protein
MPRQNERQLERLQAPLTYESKEYVHVNKGDFICYKRFRFWQYFRFTDEGLASVQSNVSGSMPIYLEPHYIAHPV